MAMKAMHIMITEKKNPNHYDEVFTMGAIGFIHTGIQSEPCRRGNYRNKNKSPTQLQNVIAIS